MKFVNFYFLVIFSEKNAGYVHYIMPRKDYSFLPFKEVRRNLNITSRERPKSAPYLRLKKTKTTFSTTGDNKNSQKTKN